MTLNLIREGNEAVVREFYTPFVLINAAHIKELLSPPWANPRPGWSEWRCCVTSFSFPRTLASCKESKGKHIQSIQEQCTHESRLCLLLFGFNFNVTLLCEQWYCSPSAMLQAIYSLQQHIFKSSVFIEVE